MGMSHPLNTGLCLVQCSTSYQIYIINVVTALLYLIFADKKLDKLESTVNYELNKIRKLAQANKVSLINQMLSFIPYQ